MISLIEPSDERSGRRMEEGKPEAERVRERAGAAEESLSRARALSLPPSLFSLFLYTMSYSSRGGEQETAAADREAEGDGPGSD